MIQARLALSIHQRGANLSISIERETGEKDRLVSSLWLREDGHDQQLSKMNRINKNQSRKMKEQRDEQQVEKGRPRCTTNRTSWHNDAVQSTRLKQSDELHLISLPGAVDRQKAPPTLFQLVSLFF